MISNVITSADSYKLSHFTQIFPGTTQLYETFTPRSLKHLPAEARELTNNHLVWFGVQATVIALHEAFDNEFFSRPFSIAIENLRNQAIYFAGPTFSVEPFRKLHSLGYLPIRIKSLPEGSLIPARIPGLTITNTHPDFAWLVGYLETVLSNETWKSVNNATIAFAYRRLLTQAATRTGAPVEFVKWQGHDFSSRGMSGSTDAARQGISHLTSFLGSDGIGSTPLISKYYDVLPSDFIAGSIPASEHMTETLAIQVLAKRHNISLAEAEYLQFKRHITELYPTGLVARVCDSYDYWNVITNIIPRLKSDILSRNPDDLGMAKVVIRPDSGNPIDIICGTAIPVSTLTDIERYFRRNPTATNVWFVTYKSGTNQYFYYSNASSGDSSPALITCVPAEVRGSIACLWETFGGTINSSGYRNLNSHIGLIYGDSITIKRAKEIVTKLEQLGFASTNVVLGIGSYTYQMSSRDTLGMALKATFAVVDGVEIDLNKDPKTDDGTKRSAKGRVRVEYLNDDYILLDQQSVDEEQLGLLQTIYCDGQFSNLESFSTIRSRIDSLV